MEQITFDTLPEAVNELRTDINEIKRLLLQKSNELHQPEPDQFLTVSEAASLLKLQPCTIYGLVHTASIPVNKRNKRLYFSRQELTDWIKAGRKKTTSEIAAEAEQYVNGKKKGR